MDIGRWLHSIIYASMFFQQKHTTNMVSMFSSEMSIDTFDNNILRNENLLC